MSTTSSAAQPLRHGRHGPGLGHNAIGIILAVVLAPLIAMLASSAEFLTIGAVAAALVLLLVVLWSAEATFYVLIFSMLLSPELIVGDLAAASYSTSSRGVTLRLDDYIIVIIGLAWLVRLAVYKEAAVLRRTRINVPIGAYIGFSMIATLIGALMGRLDLTTGFFFVLKYLEYSVIFFLVINYVRDREHVRRLLTAVIVTAMIIAIIAIAQIPAGGRVSAPFEGERGEPNTLGGYLVLMLALALALLSESKSHGQRVLWFGATALLTLPLMYTLSRTSWLAFCVMFVVLVALSRNRAGYLLLGSGALIALIVSPPASLVERATYTLSSQSNGIEFLGFTIEPSAAARLEAWGIAAEALAKYPITGAGVTGYGLIDAQYPRLLAETGLIGFGLFLWLVWRLVGTGFDLRERATTKVEVVLATAFLAGLAGMLMHGIGANTFIIVRIMEPLWLLAGLVSASLIIIREEEAGLRPATESTAG